MSTSDATPQAEIFVRSRTIAGSTGFERFGHVAVTGSTNADLVREARAGETGSAVLVADHQTAGRGRLDRSWDDEPGKQLLVSLRMPAGDDPSAVPGALAVAAHDAVAALGVPVGVKWPNDLVVVDGPAPGKLAGMLSEFVRTSPAVIVAGIGINVDSAPADGATSLSANGSKATRDEVLAAVLQALADVPRAPTALRHELVRRSATLGRRVRVERHGDEIVGTAVDIDIDGCLLVDVNGTIDRVSVGDVVHVRPMSPTGD